MFGSVVMATARGKDTSCLSIFVANGLLVSSDNVLVSSDNVLVSSPALNNRNILTVATSGFDCQQPVHSNTSFPNNNHSNHRLPGDSRLPSNNRLPSTDSQEPLDLLPDDSDLSGLSSFADGDQEDLDEFAKRFSEEIETFDGTTGREPLATFGSDNAGVMEENADGSPQSQTNSEGSFGTQMKNRLGQRNKGRPAKVLTGVTSNRTIIQCPVCQKTFNNSSALAKHKLIHSDERKYTCTICSKAFKRQDHLNGHIMTHCSKKPYECKFIGCDKSYCDARSLRRHHENHHQQLLDGSAAVGSDANLTPGLTPNGNNDSQSGIFRFDLPSPFPGQEQGFVFREVSVSPSHEMSPLSPSVSVSPSATSLSAQKTGAWTSGFNPLDEPKPVQCSICDRRFRNMPALNGHMRLHGGYMKKDVTEAEKQEDLPNSSDKGLVTQEIEPSSSSSSFNLSCGQLSKASSCSTLSTIEPVFSPHDIIVPKQEDNFPNFFVSSALVTSGNSLNCPAGFLESCLEPKQVDEVDFKARQLQEQMMDQTQDLVSQLHLVDNVQPQSLSLAGLPWMGNHLFGQSSSSGSMGEVTAASEKLIGADQKAEMIIPGQIQRLMQAASQLSINIPNVLSQQTNTDSSPTDFDHLSSSSVAPANSGSHGFGTGSVNTTAMSTVLAGGKLHPLLVKNQPSIQGIIPRGPPPLALHSSTIYSGMPTPCTPQSPFLIRTLHSQTPGHSQVSSSSSCFQFPSKTGGKEGHMTSHPSTPNLVSYVARTQHTPRTPHSPYTPQPKTPYTPNTPSRTRHFQFPPSESFLEGITSAGTSYSHHHPKSYHPYFRPVPMSPRYVHQSLQQQELDERKRQEEDFMQVEQKINEHVQLLHQEDLKKQQMSLQALNCVTMETGHKDFPLLQSVLEDNAPECATSSIDVQKFFEGIERESGSFDVAMELSSACPVLDSLTTMNPGELSALLEQKPVAIDHVLPLPTGDLGQDVPVEEVIQLLREQFGDDVITNSDLDLTDVDIVQSPVAMETYQFPGNGDKMVVPLFCSSSAMDCVPITSSELQTSGTLLGFDLGTDSSRNEKFFSPLESAKKGRKHRPEPLCIPSNVNNYGFASQLRSPRLRDSSRKKVMPYTPPPMISPARKGSGVFWTLVNNKVPQSAPPYNCGSTDREQVHYTFDQPSTVDNSQPPETDVLPHVNIGPEFQAHIPPVSSDRVEPAEKNTDTKEMLIWDPKTMDGLTEEELLQYQEFVCCASIPGNGTNKEEALHLLQLCNGSTKKAKLRLMTGESSHRGSYGGGGGGGGGCGGGGGGGSSSFRCKESDSWKEDEIEKYHNALLISDKDFTEIAKEVGTKTVKQCIQFYYIWKKLCTDDYKALCQKRHQALANTCSLAAELPRNQMVLDIAAGLRSGDHGL